MLSFDDFKNSFIKNLYHLENDIFCIFKTTELTKEDLSKLCLEAKQHVTHGFIFQTSGSTASKKFVLHDFDSIKTSANSVSEWTDVQSKDKFLAPISIFHMGGFSVLSRSVFASAAPAVILEQWSLNKFLEIIEADKITITSLVPSLIYEIVQAKVKAPTCLRVVFVGGSGLSVELMNQALNLGWPILRTFGSSEACSQIFSQRQPSNATQTALPHWQIRLNEMQQLQIKGQALYKGYLIIKNDKVKFAQSPRDEGGYFTTEDLVQLQGRTLKSFLGRINDFIKINSTLVHLESLRSRFTTFCLQNKIDPTHNLIVAKVDLKSGYRLIAYTSSSIKNLNKLIKTWNSECPAHERISGLCYIDEIPKNELGKPLYSHLP